MMILLHVFAYLALGLLPLPGQDSSAAQASTEDAGAEPAGLEMLLVLTPSETYAASWWYRVPGDMGPPIYQISEVVEGQHFSIVPIFSHFAKDEEGLAHVTYDLRQVHADGTTGFEQAAFEGLAGKYGSPQILQLARALPRLALNGPGAVGDHRLIVEAHDLVSGATVTGEVQIHVRAWEPEKNGALNEDPSAFVESYYKHPRPDAAYQRFRRTMELELKNDHPSPMGWSRLAFYRAAFNEERFVLDELAADFNEASPEDQREIAMLLLLLGAEAKLEGVGDDAAAALAWARKTGAPDPYGELVHPVQLDMLWSEFLATGSYEPIAALLDALRLAEYAGALDAFPSSEQSDSDKLRAFKDSIYQAAVWSLESNARMHTRVWQYMNWAAQSGELDPEVQVEVDKLIASIKEG